MTRPNKPDLTLDSLLRAANTGTQRIAQSAQSTNDIWAEIQKLAEEMATRATGKG